MKQQSQTLTDFQLQNPIHKTNPFLIHMPSNSCSLELTELRNTAFILNKLNLLHLQHPSTLKQYQYVQQYLELYGTCLNSVINSDAMSYKNQETVKELVNKVQYYYQILAKLTIQVEMQTKQGAISRQLKRKMSIDGFWPRVRAMLSQIQDKIPQNCYWIRERVAIKRGILQPNKQYFVDQMKARNIRTPELKTLIQSYTTTQQQNVQQLEEEQQKFNKNVIKKDWKQVKKHVRAIVLTNQVEDWNIVLDYLNSEPYTQCENEKKSYINQYIQQVLSTNSMKTQKKVDENNQNWMKVLKIISQK